MKKIMKKVLSLALVIALAIAPMTVMAADTGTADYATGLYQFEGIATVAANSTVYYEICMPDDAQYEFVVTGPTGFSVGTCYEIGGVWEIGAGADDTNGTVNTTIKADSQTWYGYAGFAIENMTASEQEYTYEIVLPEGTQGNPKAVTLAVGGTAQVTVPAQTQYYVGATLPQMYTEYQLTITGNTGFGYTGGYGMPNWDSNGTYTTTLAAYFGPASFAIVNNTASEQTYTLTLTDVPKPLGSELNPDTLPMNTTTTKELNGDEYWYTWTATEAGTLTITMDNAQCADGWTYKALCSSSNVPKHFSTGWDESDKNICEFTVATGDVVTYSVSVPTGSDPYTLANGTVVFTTAFVAGEGNPDGGDDGAGDGGSGSDGITPGGDEINENYYYKYQELTVGTNDIMPMFGYPTTLYTFVPTEAGEYLVTIDEQGATLGYYGSNEWYPFDYTETKTSSLTLEVAEANAPMLIGVSDAMLATVTITRVGDLDDEGGYDEIEYENVVTPEEFTFPGNAETLLDSYVDTTDDTVETAVLGDDGYYHLNSADGPVLFANLSDELMNLVTAQSYGQLSAVNYESGVPVSITDFYNAFDEYVACADVESIEGATLYPLTEDLITIFQRVGEDKVWYGENGFVGGTEEDAWMFACYYDEAITSLAPSTGGATGGATGGVAGGTTQAPKTGDNANVAVWAIVMVVAAGAAFVVAESKRRAR